MSAAQATQPALINFHWGVTLEDVDFKEQQVSFSPVAPAATTFDSTNDKQQQQQQQQQQRQQVPYDLLVGADGARSDVRDRMARALGGMTVRQLSSPVAAMQYKAFHELPDCPEVRAMLPDAARTTTRPGSFFFALTNPTADNPSPGSVTLYYNVSRPGTWSGVMYQPPGSYQSIDGDANAHAAAVRRLVPAGFPEAWVAPMAEQMAAVGPSG